MLKSLAAALVVFTLVPMASGTSAAQPSTNTGWIDEHALFRVVGAMYGLDPDLLEAIAAAESHGDARAVSAVGAMGLMQLMPATAWRFDVTDPFDPVESAIGAARFLDHLRREAACRELPELLAAYNAGVGAVKHYRGIPPYRETRDYVRRVLWLYLLAAPSLPHSNLQRRARADFLVAHKVASHGLQYGDQAVLNQLAELKRRRAATRAASGAR